MFDIISIGTATRDMFCIGTPFVEVESEKFKTLKGLCLSYGSKVELPNVLFTTGGAGTNAAVAFARAGFKTACLSRIGSDPGGNAILDELEKEGVDSKYFQIDKEKFTAYSIIFLTSEGERTILSYKGAGEHLSEKEIPWEEIKKTNWFYLDSLGGNKELLRQLLEFAKVHNIKIASNPGARELKILKENKDWLKNYDIFTLNQEEASDLTRINYKNEKEIFDELDRLVGGVVVMTKGPRGAVVSDGKNRFSVGIFKEKKLIDRTGAGDAFASAFVSGFIKTDGIEQSIKWGSANSTSVVEHIGAKEGILKEKDYQDERWQNLEIVRA
ncbi:MAG: PfkB family kinase, nonfunctional [Parcubacteria group bacterium GW2011_GWA2_39_18]|nr:MAG: PfkB family kinase, nonfunctional [Parcubacteria group bacterium GW2011_GWA2_39_18]